jgi:hypothetical protein
VKTAARHDDFGEISSDATEIYLRSRPNIWTHKAILARISSDDSLISIYSLHGMKAMQRRLLNRLLEKNRQHQLRQLDNSNLAARIASYELAYKMQQHVPEAVNLADETESTQKLYGLDQPRTEDFARKCILARRLVERGVRLIQFYSGGNHNDANWDAHGDLEKTHNYHAGNTDRPIAGLLMDLKQRGLLDSTLVVWGGELGAAAVENPFHVKRLHATILNQIGMDPNKLSYFYGVLDQKLVGVEHGEPIREIIS